MWSKFGLLLCLSASAVAHDGDNEPSPPYEVKETARFYRWDTYDKMEKKYIYLSFVVPKGFTLEGCGSIEPGFLEGKDCGQDEFPLMHTVLEKDGVRRWVEIKIGGGDSI